MTGNDIVQVFLAEAREIFERLESDLVRLEEDSSDRENINRIFRYVHTLKGSSGIAGFNSVSTFTHDLENLLDEVRADTLEVDKGLIDLILDGVDWIKEEIFQDKTDPVLMEDRMLGLLERIHIMKTGEKPASGEGKGKSSLHRAAQASQQRYYQVIAYFNKNIFESGIDPLVMIEDLASMGTVISRKVKRDELPPFKQMDPEKCYIGWELVLKSDVTLESLKDVFLFVRDDNRIEVKDITSDYLGEKKQVRLEDKRVGDILVEKGILSEGQLDQAIKAQATDKSKIGDILIKKGLVTEKDVGEALNEQERIKKKIEVSTVRVDTGKLDRLLNLLGEIVIGQAALARITEEMEDESSTRIKNSIYALDRTTREFQEQIMSIRMIPVGPTFELYRRFVRDSAQTMGKKIRLVIQGGETELDKTVIERITDPLKHMIRNSIDHGIEIPEEREALGKEPVGIINVNAYHQEGNVFIDIKDDGKGISLEKLRDKAVSLGLIKTDEQVPRERLFSFLFVPGFSTAEKVGDLSGRGVGMDVVKTNIESLRGSVSVDSEEGDGTLVRIKLPLTLAIIDGMLIRVGEHIYIVPLLSVVESLKPQKKEIKTIEGKGEVIYVRDEYVTLLRLYDFFQIESEIEDPCEGLVVVVESGTTKIGILVDELIGQQQIVIKSLDEFITSSRSISGASILGDGTVALIIDIHGLAALI